MQKVSRVTGGIIRHRLMEEARSLFVPLSIDAGDGLVVLLLGPTQSGKSMLFREVVTSLNGAFRDGNPGAIPVIDLQIETVGDGRARPKWLGIELLKALKHPVYEHIGAMDEGDYYAPSKGRDEGTIRIALKEGLRHRSVRRVCLDEVHLLTHTKDPDLRAAILESIKSTCAIDRTLIACGGYEIAYRGLFDSAHFCGRVITCDFGSYDVDRKEDVHAWARILKTYGEHLKLKSDGLLLDEFEFLMVATNGVVGLLDKMLWRAAITAKARGCSIDRSILLSCAPPADEKTAIRKDIQLGRAALRSMDVLPKSTPCDVGQKSLPEKVRKPFERNPNRNAVMDITLDVDD